MLEYLKKNYLTNGDFGEVRWVHFPINHQEYNLPFLFRHGGWHKVNSKYRVQRMMGIADHILLFSLTEGGVLQLDESPPIFLPALSVAWIPPHHKHLYFTRTRHIWEFYWLQLAKAPHICFESIFQERPFIPVSHMANITREMEKLLSSNYTLSLPFSIETSRVCSNIYHMLLREFLKKEENFYKEDLLISTVMQDINANFSHNLNLTQLSQKYYISVPQLIRRFKKATDMSPHTYIMSIRLQRAGEFLQYTNLSVAEISQLVGFLSASNMITQFRKVYGMTPGEYRKNNQY